MRNMNKNLTKTHPQGNYTSPPKRTVGSSERNIETKMPGVREAAYNTLVRLHLYAAAVWDPHHKENITRD